MSPDLLPRRCLAVAVVALEIAWGTDGRKGKGSRECREQREEKELGVREKELRKGKQIIVMKMGVSIRTKGKQVRSQSQLCHLLVLCWGLPLGLSVNPSSIICRISPSSAIWKGYCQCQLSEIMCVKPLARDWWPVFSNYTFITLENNFKIFAFNLDYCLPFCS